MLKNFTVKNSADVSLTIAMVFFVFLIIKEVINIRLAIKADNYGEKSICIKRLILFSIAIVVSIIVKIVIKTH